uniref:Uncharacterized protein n=1 Tax=Romanomermis culicivorax TaxID=13658 RepID=A0A915IXT9_ROMCU
MPIKIKYERLMNGVVGFSSARWIQCRSVIRPLFILFLLLLTIIRLLLFGPALAASTSGCARNSGAVVDIRSRFRTTKIGYHSRLTAAATGQRIPSKLRVLVNAVDLNVGESSTTAYTTENFEGTVNNNALDSRYFPTVNKETANILRIHPIK